MRGTKEPWLQSISQDPSSSSSPSLPHPMLQTPRLPVQRCIVLFRALQSSSHIMRQTPVIQPHCWRTNVTFAYSAYFLPFAPSSSQVACTEQKQPSARLAENLLPRGSPSPSILSEPRQDGARQKPQGTKATDLITSAPLQSASPVSCDTPLHLPWWPSFPRHVVLIGATTVPLRHDLQASHFQCAQKYYWCSVHCSA